MSLAPLWQRALIGWLFTSLKMRPPMEWTTKVIGFCARLTWSTRCHQIVLQGAKTHFSHPQISRLPAEFVLAVFKLKEELLGKVQYRHYVLSRARTKVGIVPER